jgi:hypothetical protein
MANRGELLINVVSNDKPKRLIGLSQKALWTGMSVKDSLIADTMATGEKAEPTPSRRVGGTWEARQVPIRESELQGQPIAWRVQEEGASECCPAMGQIAVASRQHHPTPKRADFPLKPRQNFVGLCHSR